MNTHSYMTQYNKAVKPIFFTDQFFEHLSEEFSVFNQEQKIARQEEIKKIIAFKLAQEHYDNFPYLLGSILRESNGKYEVLVLGNPEIFTLVIDAFNTENTSNFKMQASRDSLPPKLASDALSKIFHDYLDQFHQKKRNQYLEFVQGKRFIHFAPGEPPRLSPFITKDDLTIETMSACSAKLMDFVKDKNNIDECVIELTTLKKRMDEFFTENKDDKVFSKFCFKLLEEQGFFNQLKKVEEKTISSLTYTKEMATNLEQNDVLKEKMLDFFKSKQYLSFYLEHIAWTVHFIACKGHMLLQEKTKNKNRTEDIKKFIHYFSTIIKLPDDGNIPPLIKWKHAFSTMSLEEAKRNINVLLSNDPYGIAQKIFAESNQVIDNTIYNGGYVTKEPFLTTLSRWGTGQFDFSKETYSLEAQSIATQKYLHAFFNDIFTPPKYLYTDRDEAEFKKTLHQFESLYKRMLERKSNLERERKKKQQLIGQKAWDYECSMEEKLSECKMLPSGLPEQTDAIANLTQRLKKISHDIRHFPRNKVLVNLGRKKPVKDHLDHLYQSLLQLNLEVVEFHNVLNQKAQERMKEAALEQVIETERASNALMHDYQTYQKHMQGLRNDLRQTNFKEPEELSQQTLSKLEALSKEIQRIKQTPINVNLPASTYKTTMLDAINALKRDLHEAEQHKTQFCSKILMLEKASAQQEVRDKICALAPVQSDVQKLRLTLKERKGELNVDSEFEHYQTLLQDFQDTAAKIDNLAIDEQIFSLKDKLINLIQDQTIKLFAAHKRLQVFAAKLHLEDIQERSASLNEAATGFVKDLHLINKLLEPEALHVLPPHIYQLSKNTHALVKEIVTKTDKSLVSLKKTNDLIQKWRGSLTEATTNLSDLDRQYQNVSDLHEKIKKQEQQIAKEIYRYLLREAKLVHDHYHHESKRYRSLGQRPTYKTLHKALNEKLFSLKAIIDETEDLDVGQADNDLKRCQRIEARIKETCRAFTALRNDHAKSSREGSERAGFFQRHRIIAWTATIALAVITVATLAVAFLNPFSSAFAATSSVGLLIAGGSSLLATVGAALSLCLRRPKRQNHQPPESETVVPTSSILQSVLPPQQGQTTLKVQETAKVYHHDRMKRHSSFFTDKKPTTSKKDERARRHSYRL